MPGAKPAVLKSQKARWELLRLCVTGTTPRSAKVILNMRAICEEKLHRHYDLEGIDIYQQPEPPGGDRAA